MGKINLQESYLHNVLMSSINKLIREDINDNNTFEYLNDIINGNIDEMEDGFDNDITRVRVIGGSGKGYDIMCYAWRDEISPYTQAKLGNRYDDYESDIPAEYDYELEVKSVECFDDELNEYQDITSLVDVQKISQWLESNLDWEELENNRMPSNVFDDFGEFENEGEY